VSVNSVLLSSINETQVTELTEQTSCLTSRKSAVRACDRPPLTNELQPSASVKQNSERLPADFSVRVNSTGPLTARQLDILQHSLGADRYGQGGMNRNHFCAGASDEPTCRELVALGYMREHLTTEIFPYFNCSVTDAGKAAMLAQSPKPPKLTRGQRRYREYLKADTGRSFGEWLKDQAEATDAR